jgi:hypothetical protein
MAAPTTTYRMWKRLAERPGGTRLFSAAALTAQTDTWARKYE